MFKQLPKTIENKLVGERRFELPASWSRTKRATRLRYSPTECKINDLTLKVQDHK